MFGVDDKQVADIMSGHQIISLTSFSFYGKVMNVLESSIINHAKSST
jgi:hypothetical protein